MTNEQRMQALKELYDTVCEGDEITSYPNYMDALAPIISGEMVVVPAEPTYQMCQAGEFNWEGTLDGKVKPFPIRYRAMLKETT